MTELWTYTLLPGGSLISRGQTELKSFAAVSEPSSALMFGAAGLLGFGLVRRRRRI